MNKTDNNKIKSFTDLNAWKESHKLVIDIYKITKKFPKEETYSLTDQMRRAVISITSNIAEGFGRHTYKEKVQFYYQAQGSLVELKNQLLAAKDIGYLEGEDFQNLALQSNVAHQLLQGLITKSKSFINHKSCFINQNANPSSPSSPLSSSLPLFPLPSASSSRRTPPKPLG